MQHMWLNNVFLVWLTFDQCRSRNEAAHDPMLQKLLRCDISGYTNQSSVDFVLIMKLLHWTGNITRLVSKFFLASTLGQREKARRPTSETTYFDMLPEQPDAIVCPLRYFLLSFALIRFR